MLFTSYPSVLQSRQTNGATCDFDMAVAEAVAKLAMCTASTMNEARQSGPRIAGSFPANQGRKR